MGKSAFAASLSHEYSIRNRVLGTFFCKYGLKTRSNGKNIVKSLAYQCYQAMPECLAKMRNGAKRLNEVRTFVVIYISLDILISNLFLLGRNPD